MANAVVSLSVGESTRSLAWNDRPRLRCAVITPKCEGLLVIIMIEPRDNTIPQGRRSLVAFQTNFFSKEMDSSKCNNSFALLQRERESEMKQGSISFDKITIRRRVSDRADYHGSVGDPRVHIWRFKERAAQLTTYRACSSKFYGYDRCN